MTWSFPGISFPVECVYTQTRGVHPDVALLKFLPQVTNFASAGTLTMVWDAATITLPNCISDTTSLQYHADGIHHVMKILDRRELWKNAPRVSGYYNIARTGPLLTANQKTLRELVTLLLNQLGEATIDVSSVPATLYPEVRWVSQPTHLTLELLLKENGLDLTLGFGSEAVKVVVVGTGASLPSGNEYMQSLTADPKLRPAVIRVAFGPSRMQARFHLEAVGREDDGTWLPINYLSYAPPGGWGAEDPYTMSSVLANDGEEIWNLARQYVFRAYRVVAFSTDTLVLPDGSVTLSKIEDVMPLIPRLLDTEDVRLGDSYRQFRVFGSFYREVKERGQPAVFEVTDIDYEILHLPASLDYENGVLLFDHDPVFLVEADEFVPADLYLECTFEVKHQTNFAPSFYEKDIPFDGSGYGYLTLPIPTVFGKSVISYNATHSPTGVTTNQTDLDALATAHAAVIASSLSNELHQVKVYSIPKLSIRCDGAIMQVQHILTNGDGNYAVNRTRASRFREFDRGVPSQAQKFAHAQATISALDQRWKDAVNRREDPSDE